VPSETDSPSDQGLSANRVSRRASASASPQLSNRYALLGAALTSSAEFSTARVEIPVDKQHQLARAALQVSAEVGLLHKTAELSSARAARASHARSAPSRATWRTAAHRARRRTLRGTTPAHALAYSDLSQGSKCRHPLSYRQHRALIGRPQMKPARHRKNAYGRPCRCRFTPAEPLHAVTIAARGTPAWPHPGTGSFATLR